MERVASEGGLAALQANEVWLRTGADIFEQLYGDFDGRRFPTEEINFPPGTPETEKKAARREFAKEAEDEWAAEGARTKKQADRMRQEAKSIRRALGGAEFDERSGSARSSR